MADSARARHGDEDDASLSLLLVQLGFHAARRFSDALAPLGLKPRQFGVLRRLASQEGQSQQALGKALNLTPTRMVFLTDDLESHGLVERRRNPADRRAHALYLTARGRDAIAAAQAASKQHEAALGATLDQTERSQLIRLLRRLAAEQGIDERSLPGPPPGRS